MIVSLCILLEQSEHTKILPVTKLHRRISTMRSLYKAYNTIFSGPKGGDTAPRAYLVQFSSYLTLNNIVTLKYGL